MSEPPVPPPPTPPPAAPRVRIGEWFDIAWQTFKPVWLEVVVAMLVYQFVLAVAYLLCLLPGLILIGPLTAGLFVYLGKLLLGERPELTDIFLGTRRFADTAILGLVLWLAPAVVLALVLVPAVAAAVGIDSLAGSSSGGALGGVVGCFGCLVVPLFFAVYPVVVGTFFVFSFPLVVFRGRSAVEALKESWALVAPKFWNFLALLLACWVLFALAWLGGLALAGVGALLLSPLAQALVLLMQLAAYRDFVGLREADLAPYR